MVEHMVLFKFIDGVTSDQKNKMIAGLRRLKAIIPEIVDLTVGENFTDRSKGFHCGLVVRLMGRDGLKAYAEHPEHQAVVASLIKPIVTDIIAIDYEIDSNCRT